MSEVKSILTLGCLQVLCLSASAATPPLDLMVGHFEAQIDYELTPGAPDAGWTFAVSYDVTNDFNTAEGIIRLDPATTRIIASPQTQTTLPDNFFSLGDGGAPVWILPAASPEGEIYFGWRTVISPGIFQLPLDGFFTEFGSDAIIIDLIDVSGPAVDAGGKFAMWGSPSLGGIDMHFNTADGIDASDRLGTVPIDTHIHYTYALTQPGNYEVTFRASGRLRPELPDGNQDTSGTGTFHFSVPFSSVATEEAELRLSIGDPSTPAAIHPLDEPVEYAPGQVMLQTQAVELGDHLHPYAFRLLPKTDNDLVASHRIGIPGHEPIAFPPEIISGSDPVEILGITGPGTLQQFTQGEALYFLFSEAGIYRVQARALGSQGGQTIHGTEFELVFLAGLEPDYNFAAYAESFERTHGLPPNSLSEDLENVGDWDGDGVPDLVEFHLFWEGMDPAISDAHKLPLPDPEDHEQVIVFHRDSYKDRIYRNLENIVLEYSTDLKNWRGWSDRNPGWPLELYESGAEVGNAYGRIHRRAIRLPEGAPSTGYFRWRIDPAN